MKISEIPVPPGMTIEEHHDGVATVMLDRPERANAVDRAMHTRLTTLWADLAAHPGVRAVILTGAGSVFCGGGNRTDWPELIEDRSWRREKMAEARAIVMEMLRCPVPMVAAINGPAIGLGCSLALGCDVMILAEDAFLADPHVRTGLVAGDGGAALLPELVPLTVARRMLFNGDRLSADEAVALSLAVAVVAREDLLDRAGELACEFAGQPREALRDTKRAINGALLRRIASTLEFSSAAEETSFDTPEFQTAIGYRSADTEPAAS